MLRHGSVVRSTMFLANMDIKTVFDEARPRHVAEIMENHEMHGWLIAAPLREMSGLGGEAMRGERIRLQSVFAPGKRRSSTFVAENCHSDFRLMWKKNGQRKEWVFSWTSKMKEHNKYAASGGAPIVG